MPWAFICGIQPTQLGVIWAKETGGLYSQVLDKDFQLITCWTIQSTNIIIIVAYHSLPYTFNLSTYTY